MITHLVVGQFFGLGHVDQGVFGDVHIAQLRADLDDVFHAPAGDGHFAAVFHGGVDGLLHAVDVGGKGGHDDALVAAGEQLVEGAADGALGLGVAGTLHIGGVAQQGQHALFAQLAEAAQVDDLAVDGRGVDLKVAGVDDGAHFGADGEGGGIGDGVVHVDELHLEFARFHALACFHGGDLGLAGQSVLFQLQLDQARGQAGAEDGHVDLAQHIGDGADVVFVAVGDEQAPDAVGIFHQIGHVGNDHVHAVHIVAGEGHAAVHHDDVAAVFVNGQVLADLVETAKGNDFDFFCHGNGSSSKMWYVSSPWQIPGRAKQGRLPRNRARKRTRQRKLPPAGGRQRCRSRKKKGMPAAETALIRRFRAAVRTFFTRMNLFYLITGQGSAAVKKYKKQSWTGEKRAAVQGPGNHAAGRLLNSV